MPSPAPAAAGQGLPRGALVQQGSGYLSPRVQTFLCCNGEGSAEDPHFYVVPGGAVAEAVEQVGGGRAARRRSCRGEAQRAARTAWWPPGHPPGRAC